MSVWQTAGKVRMTPKGTYSTASSYQILDLVTNIDDTTFYIAKQDVPAGTALDNTIYWAVVADVSDAVNNVADALDYLGETYSTSDTYDVGDYVIHDGGLYRCISAIETAETWTAAHWQEICLADEYADLRDNVVKVSTTEPSSDVNQIWFDPNATETQVPTWEEFSEVKSALGELKNGEELLDVAVYKKLGNGNQPQLTSSVAANIIAIQNPMTIEHKYKIMLKFNNYTDSDFVKLSAFYVAIGTSGSDRKEDLITDVRSAIGGNTTTGFVHLGEWISIEYTASANISYLRPQYISSYAPETDTSIDWVIYDLDAYNFADKEIEEIASKNEADIQTINSELYNVISSGNKTQGGNYGGNCISFGATLYAGKTYNISLRFNGTYSTFLTYLNNLYLATSDASTGRVEDIKPLFTAIESPLSVGKLYTVEYTPAVNVAYLGPSYSSNYSPSADNSIDYKVVEKESRIDKLEQIIGSDDFYNFTPINTWEESAVPSAITQKLNAMENDVLCVFQGDSLTGLTEYSGAQDEPEHCPPGMQYKSWTYWLWENLARVKPLCDRLDSQRNGTDFFTKTGTWEQVDGTKFDAEGYTPDFQRERSVACLTYQSSSANASVSFAFDADTHEKCNIVFSLKPDGADCEIAIAEGNGKMLVSLDRSTWVEANGYMHTQQSNPDELSYSQIQSEGLATQQRHRRLWLKKVNGVTGTVNITYKKSTTQTLGTSYMYCWGTERWSGNTVFIDNAGRGGRYTRFLSYNISDIFDRNPDFAVYEMPLANETDEGLTNIYGFYQQYFTSSGNNSYKTRSENYTKVPLIVFLPHGRGVFFNANNAAIFDSTHQIAGDPPAYVIYMTIWNWLKEQLSSYSNVSVINLYCRLLNEATGIGQPIMDVFGTNGEYAFTQDTVHLNSRGARMYCKYLLPLFQR